MLRLGVVVAAVAAVHSLRTWARQYCRFLTRPVNYSGKYPATRLSDLLKSHLLEPALELCVYPLTERIPAGRTLRLPIRYPAIPIRSDHIQNSLQD